MGVKERSKAADFYKNKLTLFVMQLIAAGDIYDITISTFSIFVFDELRRIQG